MDEQELETIRNTISISEERFILLVSQMRTMEDWLNSLIPTLRDDGLIFKYYLMARSVYDWVSEIRFQMRRFLFLIHYVQATMDRVFYLDQQDAGDVWRFLEDQKDYIEHRLLALLDNLEFEVQRFNQLEHDVKEYYQW